MNTQVSKVYRVEDIAAQTGMSKSYINMRVSKDKPEAVKVLGRRKYYSKDYIEKILADSPKPRKRTPKMIVMPKQAEATNAPTKPVEPLAEAQEKPLLERIKELEGAIKRLERLLGT